MTLASNSYLFLKRLVVVNYLGGIAYDKSFHLGVNIIRGKNSSGKSTIANLLFYALGGDFANWNTESLKCLEVFAEVDINGGTYTLRRTISSNSRQPMSVFWGDYDESRKNGGEWKTFSYSQSEERLSFSNILFNALSFPEVKNEQESNLTMHQILRLLYIDQDSPTQNLFRFENFDHPLIRQAISELLLGVYDDSLYNDRINLKKKTKEYEEKERTLESQTKAFTRAGNASSLEELSGLISTVSAEIDKVSAEISQVIATPKIRIAVNSNLRVEQLQKDLIRHKENLTNLVHDINQLDLDILDSKQFIEMLENRVTEIGKSIAVRKSLGELSLAYCPECLLPLDDHVPEGDCSLCKKSLPQDELRTHAKRLKQELELQVKESRMLLVKKEERVSGMKGKLPQIKQQLVSVQRQLDTAIATSQSTRDDKLDELLLKKGGLENQVKILTSQTETLSHLEFLKRELVRLTAEKQSLELNIRSKETIQNRNKSAAMEQIEKFAILMLRQDLPRQKEFKRPGKIDIDFYDDCVALDGKFNFSASSNIYLKNAVRFAVFFGSLKVSFMRYPRFILCDNMEDKGMEQARSQNFQKLIVRLSDIYRKRPHQIIFSTSMIADELDDPKYCIGEFYDDDHLTLRV